MLSQNATRQINQQVDQISAGWSINKPYFIYCLGEWSILACEPNFNLIYLHMCVLGWRWQFGVAEYWVIVCIYAALLLHTFTSHFLMGSSSGRSLSSNQLVAGPITTSLCHCVLGQNSSPAWTAGGHQKRHCSLASVSEPQGTVVTAVAA